MASDVASNTFDAEKCKISKYSEPEFAAVLKPSEFYFKKKPERALLIRNENDWKIESIRFEFSDNSLGNVPREFNGVFSTHFIINPKKSRIFTFGRDLGFKQPGWDLYIRDQREAGSAYNVDVIIELKVYSKQTRFCYEEYTDEELKARAEKKQQQVKERQIIEIREEKERKILTNCIEDKLPPNPDQTYKKSVLSICKRASENPTLWNKVWYDYLGQ